MKPPWRDSPETRADPMERPNDYRQWTCPQCQKKHSDRNDELAASFAYCEQCREEPDLKREAAHNYIDSELRDENDPARATDTD